MHKNDLSIDDSQNKTNHHALLGLNRALAHAQTDESKKSEYKPHK